MTVTALTVALIGSVIVNLIMYRAIRNIKTRHMGVLSDVFNNMQDIIRELSFLKGETEGVKGTQEAMREAMSILTASNVQLPKKTVRRKKKEE